jgi:hypothetical protein
MFQRFGRYALLVLGELDSARIVLAIVVGVPLAVALAVVLGSSRRIPSALSGLAVLLAVGIIALSIWGIYRASGPQAAPFPTRALPQPTPSQSATPAPTCQPSGTQLTETVKNIAYQQTCLAAPANQAVTIKFTNQDSGTEHNLHIFSADPATNLTAISLFVGQLTTGPATATYNVPALQPSTYFFHCDIHPDQMMGAFVVR